MDVKKEPAPGRAGGKAFPTEGKACAKALRQVYGSSRDKADGAGAGGVRGEGGR